MDMTKAEAFPPISLFNDRNADIKVINHRSRTQRRQLMAISHHYLKDYIYLQTIQLMYVTSSENPLDMMDYTQAP